MTTITVKAEKSQKLRNNEYYNIQEKLDELYKLSKNNTKFKDLMIMIESRENILLAYRNIKTNKGSKTKGTNETTIEDIANKSQEHLIKYIRGRLLNYKPNAVRRVEIEKENGGKRPLGIPTIEDRLIQQCIKQIIEPICEAKFHEHSYGFRPNRSAHHAIARVVNLMNKGYHYAVDIDIKAFFDNVNHGKLLRQIWSMGIEDKNLLSILSKLLKSEIEGVGVPDKGVPQGGIISTVLSNITLNEFDWWISNQRETFETNHKYSEASNKFRALRTTRLKEIRVVRYADDFKILCKDHKVAQKIFIATKKWLKERLHLDISTEKSKVINLRRKYSEFLGFKLKVKIKRKKQVAISHISKKATKKILEKIKNKIHELSKKPCIETINKYNSTVLGLHNYFRVASRVNLDFGEIAFLVRKKLYNRTKSIRGSGKKSEAYLKFYGEYNYKTIYISKIALFPIACIKQKIPLCFPKGVCNYTKEGRLKVHKNQESVNPIVLKYIMENPDKGQSIEYNDNKVSLYVGQYGLCGVSKDKLKIGYMEMHHKKPKSKNGNDVYKNLTLVTADVHKLIHATNEEIIQKYSRIVKLNKEALAKLNKLRKMVGNCEIHVIK